VDWTTDSTHFVRLRWQDGLFYDALVNYDSGAKDFRSISGALADVIWW
jgi:hypothetical protein